MNFRSFSARIALLVSGLLTVTLICTFFLVNRENTNNAFLSVAADQATTEETFTSLLESRTTGLFDVVRPATRDHAFRTTFIDGHVPTLESAMRNLLSRIRYVPADVILLKDLNLESIAETTPDFIQPEQLPVEWLTDKAFESDEYESSGIISTVEAPYQLITSPLLIPDPQGWILVGFPIDDQFVQSTKEITQTDVSIAIYDGSWRISSTTLNPNQQSSFVDQLPTMLEDDRLSIQSDLDGVPYLSRLRRLDSSSDTQVYVGMHGNLNQALAPYQRLNRSLYLIFGGGLLLSALGALTLARSVSAPVKALTRGVQSIRSGDLSLRVKATSSDELGQLGGAFNEMAEGLEEKEITVLFCDVRNFTQLCESHAPQVVLAKLNRFFSRASNVIEDQNGVIDKYMGDAVMALFGAPVKHGNEENRAVAAALALRADIKNTDRVNGVIEEPLEFGIGIASGTAVVGNMGSENRLNYSVIGDSVNTCARLESLTKYYQLPVLVNEAVVLKADQFTFRWVDRIRAKGKSQVIDIFQPLEAGDQGASDTLLAMHLEAVQTYLNADWHVAEGLINRLISELGALHIYQLYLERIHHCRDQNLDSWDGVYTHTKK